MANRSAHLQNSADLAARQRRWQRLATALVALALLLIAFSFYAGQRRVQVQGPWGLAAVPGGAWLSVDQQLWRLDASGRRQRIVDTAALGGTVGLLAAHPTGGLMAWVRHSTSLYLLDASSGALLRRIEPAWPEDLRRHADEAIHLAVAPDGSFAVATGGGHAVALFDAQGQFQARSPAGTYRFTNGLWWSDGWWTTDTNGMALVKLHPQELTEVRRIALRDADGPWLFLGEAVASQGAAHDGQAPLATLSRLSNGMEYGQLVDVFDSGAQRAFEQPPPQNELAEALGQVLVPRAIAWVGGRLLAVDGLSFNLRAWDADRRLQADWGDANVRAELQQRLAERERWRGWYALSLTVAVLLLVAGLLFLAWAKRLERRLKLARLDPELAQRLVQDPKWQPGIAGQAPAPPWWRQALLLIWLLLPLLVLVGAVQAGLFAAVVRGLASPALGLTADGRWAALMAFVVVVMVLGGILMLWSIARVQSHPELEGWTNRAAQRMLARPDFFWALRQAGEQPREALVLMPRWGMAPPRWIVLTNQRLLVFRMNLHDARLEQAWPRAAVRAATLGRAGDAASARRLQLFPLLRLHLRGGEAIVGRPSCLPAAQRLVSLLQRTAPATAAMGGKSATAHHHHAQAAKTGSPDQGLAVRQTLASLLLPGAGQWWQGRHATALWMLVPWLLFVLNLAFVAWMAWGPRTEVPAHMLWLSAALPVAAAIVAATDAWRMR